MVAKNFNVGCLELRTDQYSVQSLTLQNKENGYKLVSLNVSNALCSLSPLPGPIHSEAWRCTNNSLTEGVVY